MGKEVEQIAVSRCHSVVLKVSKRNSTTYLDELKNVDIAIEFSTPLSALTNINNCFEANIPIVVGTTGWLDKFDELKQLCIQKNQTLFYASNYSIGVNLFFKVNGYLAKLMNSYPEFNAEIEEIHHIHKLDSPSGTAISLANQLIDELDAKQKWVNSPTQNKNELSIISKRIDEVSGTHTVTYNSSVDEISITHTAHNRKGFALGAIIAAEWIAGKKGVFGMNDLLSNSNNNI